MIYIGCHLSTTDGYEAMGKAITAMGGNTFAPKNNATRVQACVVILNAYNQGL